LANWCVKRWLPLNPNIARSRIPLMKELLDTVWQREGTSWVWDEQARNQICSASEIWSIRQFARSAKTPGGWPKVLPSNNDRALVVAGLDGSLDLLEPDDAVAWLQEVFKPAVLSFQNAYDSNAALAFWLPTGRHRMLVQTISDTVCWLCRPPHDRQIDFGRIMWGEANHYPQKILLCKGNKPAGLYYKRFS